MRLFVAALVILFGAAFATAQKNNSTLMQPRSRNHAAAVPRSVNDQVVAAALHRKSTTASDLAKIERGPVNHPNAAKPATTRTSAPKNFEPEQGNKNKPMNASKPGRLGHPSVHTRTKAG